MADVKSMADADSPVVAALNARVQEPNSALVQAAAYLDYSARNFNLAADDPNGTGPEWRSHLTVSQAYGVIAYLLHRLHDVDQGAASDAGWEIEEMCTEGEPLTQWVWDQVNALGVNPDSLGREEGQW